MRPCVRDGLAQWIHPEDRDRYFERTRQLLREGYVHCRYRLQDQRGEYHWLLDEARLLRDDLGMPVEAVGLWMDVTEATLAAERIEKSEERYRILVEDSPAMICRYRPDLTLIFGNKPLATYLECAPEQLPGVNLGSWMSPEQHAAFTRRLEQLTPEVPVSTAEISLQLPGREHAWWVWSDRGVFDAQGRLQEIQAVGRDNTEVRRSQQQLTQSAKMATLGEMATGLAHEINQPLNVMRMAIVNVLKRLSNGDVQIDYLQDKLNRIDAQVQRAHLRAHQPLGQTLDDERQAEGGHEQGDLRTIDQRPQHQPLDQQRPDHHHRHRQQQGQGKGHAVLVQADEGQRGEQQHRALGEVEHAAGLVDQHEADGDQRIQGAGEQAAKQGFQEEGHQCTAPR